MTGIEKGDDREFQSDRPVSLPSLGSVSKNWAEGIYAPIRPILFYCPAKALRPALRRMIE